jgi:glycosyltransferase involved in cell wall biosynthesis
MPNPERPRLTVLVVTYNHEAYIRRAVESVLMQEVVERYEVIVADDGSTDNTRKIIADVFAGTSSTPPVRYLDAAANMGITENYRRSFSACDTEYVAVLEGDDYWIHAKKLALQMAFLDEHWECAAVSANYFVYDEKLSRFTARVAVSGEFRYLDARSLIDDNLIGNFSTCMYRLSALRAIPDNLYSGIAYDWGVNICVGSDALIGFLHTPLSVYRLHDKGSWNGMDERKRVAMQLAVIEHYDRSTNFVFSSEFDELSCRLSHSLTMHCGRKPWVRRIVAILAACVPPGINLSAKWLMLLSTRYILPPIIPIAIKKMRKKMF